eukprot:861393_1
MRDITWHSQQKQWKQTQIGVQMVANHIQECNLMMINGRLDDNNAWIWLFTTENRAEITIKIVKFVAFYTMEPDNHASKTHKIKQNEANNHELIIQSKWHQNNATKCTDY